MSDLLDNLKNADPYDDPDNVCELIVEAIDEIELLRARLAEVEKELEARKNYTDADYVRLHRAHCLTADQLASATNRAAALEAALRPLVEACESDFTSEATEAGVCRERDDEPVSFTIGGIGCDLTFGHIRRGRAALAPSHCSDCPPNGYPTDKTRCDECPRKSASAGGEDGCEETAAYSLTLKDLRRFAAAPNKGARDE